MAGEESLGTAILALSTDDKGLDKGLDKGRDKATNWVKVVGGVIGGLAIGASVLAVGKTIMGVLDDSVHEAMAAQDIASQLDAVIKSTGGAAGVTAEEANDLALSLSKVTRFEDDAIVAGESMLLTFTNIGEDVFPDATEAMLDMSQALGQDMQSSAVQLGKALNDPIKGVSALSRVGVTFTQSQKDAIAAMVKVGNTAGAQKIILAELKKEFGGSAKAAGQTFAGQLDILKNSLGNVKEQIGGALLPVLTRLATEYGPKVIAFVQQFADWFGTKGVKAIADLAKWLQANLIPVFEKVSTVIRFITSAISEFSTGGSLKSWLSSWGGMSRITEIFGKTLADILIGSIRLISDAVAIVKQLLSGAGKSTGWLGKVWQQVQAIVAAVVPVIQSIIQSVLGAVQGFIAQHGEEIKRFLSYAWEKIGSIITTVLAIIMSTVVPILTAVAGFISSHSTEIQTILSNAWTIIRTVIDTVLTLIEGVVKVALAIIKGDWSGAWEIIKSTATQVWNNLKLIIMTAINLIKTELGMALDAIKALFESKWKAILKFVEDVWNRIKKAVVDGLNAVAVAIGNIKLPNPFAFLDGVIDSLRDKIEDFLNWLRGLSIPDPFGGGGGGGSGAGSSLGGLGGLGTIPVPGGGALASAMGGLLSGMAAPQFALAGAGGVTVHNLTINAPGGNPTSIERATRNGLLSAARAMGAR